MKKVLLYSASIFALMATGCSKDNFEDNELNGGEKIYSIIAEVPEDDNDNATRTTEVDGWAVSSLSSSADTRITVDTETGATKWITGDKVHLVAGTATTVTEFTATASGDGKTATLKGSGLTAGSQMIYGIHPAITTPTYINGVYTLDPITTQYNALGKIAMVAHPTSVNATTTDISERIGFSHLYTALGAKLQLPVDVEGTVVSVIIQNDATETEHIATDLGRTVNIKTDKSSGDFAMLTPSAGEKAANINITMPDNTTVGIAGTFDISARIYPANLTGMDITYIATLADGKQYYATKSGTNFLRGRYYNSTIATVLSEYTPAQYPTVNKVNGTDLSISVTNANLNPAIITHLTVNGAFLSGVDFHYMRDEMPALTILDISNAIGGATNSAIIPAAAFGLTEASGGAITGVAHANISKIIMPQQLPVAVTTKSFGQTAFYGCTNLQSINIPEGVTTIAKRAFQAVKEMTEITLPSSLITIGENSFNGCVPSGGRVITIKILNSATVINIRANSFPNNIKVKFNIPASLEAEYRAHTQWKKLLANITFVE